MNRRDFFRLGAALAVPHIVPSSVFGRAGAVAPSEYITLGAIGGGAPTLRVIAEYPPAELIERSDDHTQVWEIAREVKTTHPGGSRTLDVVKSHIIEEASGLCYWDAGATLIQRPRGESGLDGRE
jgi:hypothetical protein